MNTKQFEFTPENLPYLYQSDFHNFRFNTKGFYLDTSGNQYHYDMPEPDYFSDFTPYPLDLESNGNQYSIEKPDSLIKVTDKNTVIDTIKPADLFHNLSQCEIKRSDLKLELTNDVIDNLYNSGVRELEQFMLDTGWNTKSVLVYIAELGLYKQILLTKSGNVNKINTSKYTQEIISACGETCYLFDRFKL